MNSVRSRALELLERTDDDLTDAEIFAREANEAYWFVRLCTETLHRLPSEVEPILTQREYLTLSATNVIDRAIADMSRKFTAPPVDLEKWQ